jgi:DNA polymerase
MSEQVLLAGPADVEGWRRAARRLIRRDVPPEAVAWHVAGEAGAGDLFATEAPDMPSQAPHFLVPRAFLELTDQALLHRDPARFALMYRLLWRLRQQRRLIERDSDADIVQARRWEKAVRRDIHKMHAFVRFRAVAGEEPEHFIAWYEPDNHIVAAAVPFFVRRFANMPWTILTPAVSADWDGARLRFGPGATLADAPADDVLEELWRGYYASTFNPARLNPRMMKREMPVRFWRNLPEASLIGSLMGEADRRARAMVQQQGEAMALARREAPAKTDDVPTGRPTIAGLRARAADCRACPLWEPATQTVFGEGPEAAELVIVGEQPGDQEDIQGKPFVGPAGQLLDRALGEIGLDRSRVYVTNAVKHFKFVPRGKRRIHQKPGSLEIRACHSWLEQEIAAIQPGHIVAMGATAVQAVFGQAMPITGNRGRWLELPDGRRGLITVHPSYLLRLPDEAAKAAEYRRFVDDLRQALPYAGDGRVVGE